MRPAPAMPWAARAAAPPRVATVRRDDLRAIRQGYCALVLAAAAAQVLFFFNAEDNLLATAIALVSSLVGIAYALDGERFRRHPVSALILLLYTTTATSGALLVKTLEWTPVADRLLVPLTTFTVLFVMQVSLIVADRIYLKSQLLGAAREFLSRSVLRRTGILVWPSDGQLWMLGGMGCVSVLLTGTDFESSASFGMASAGEKLFRVFGFLKFAPFLIPFRGALSGLPVRTRSPLLLLGGYFVGLVVISFATNSRSTFADAIPTIGICALIAVGLGRMDLRRITIPKLIVFLLVAAIGGILLSRVALAMVVVRDFRTNANIGMLVGLTIDALFSNEWLEIAKAKMDTSVMVANYSETYVDSRFFGRFLLTKFHDNILYYFSLMGPDQVTSYKGFMSARLWATLPDPLLRMFGISIDKQDLIVSNGDYIIYLVDGWGLGGFKTGSMVGEIVGVYALAFPLVVIGCALLLFVVYDAFVVRAFRDRLACSPFILLLIWNLCGTTAAFGLGAESITAIPAGIVRGLPQNILVYLIAIAMVKGVTRLTGRGG